MAYFIKLEKFEGPLDLLLELIEKEKLDICEISLAQVCDQFLEYLEEHESEISTQALADFLVVAAQLILIKSKTLLPSLEIEEEDEISIEELKRRLAEYRRYKEASKEIYRIYKNKYISFEQNFYFKKIAFYPGENLTLENLFKTAKRLVSVFRRFEILDQKMLKQTVSLKDKMAHLQTMIVRKARLSFGEILKNAKDRLDAIVFFLALLELAKQRLVNVKQEKIFGEIEIEKRQQNENISS